MEKDKKIRDMYNFIFSLLFLVIAIGGMAYIGEDNLPSFIGSLGVGGYILLVLAVWRMTRLFVYDAITQFVRDWFLDVKLVNGEFVRSKYESGFKRAVSDILLCPWCFSVWIAMLMLIVLAVAPSFMFIIYILAIASLAALMQILSNLIGWHAEGKKIEVESK